MKKNSIAAYFSKLSIFSICVCFAFLFSALALPKEYLSENLPYYVIMFYVCTALSYLTLYFVPRKTGMKFMNVFLICKLVKFVVYLGVLAAVILLDIEQNAKFALTYCVLFVFFLVFDTMTSTSLSKAEAARLRNKAEEQTK